MVTCALLRPAGGTGCEGARRTRPKQCVTNAGALRLAAESLGVEVESQWHATREFRTEFEGGGVRFTGLGERGEPRLLELGGHPFFFATLFQPERASRSGRPHPLITAFVGAAKVAHEARLGSKARAWP